MIYSRVKFIFTAPLKGLIQDAVSVGSDPIRPPSSSSAPPLLSASSLLPDRSTTLIDSGVLMSFVYCISTFSSLSSMDSH